MASIFFRKKSETGLWWIKARSAQSRALVRSSLQARDEAMAQLFKRRIELELELRRPEPAGLDIPVGLLAEWNWPLLRKPPRQRTARLFCKSLDPCTSD